MTREATSFPRRHTMLATFAAVAFFGAAGVAQAQSTTTSPTQTTPSATDTNRDASQGMAPGTRDTRPGTMRSDDTTSGSTMGTQSGSSSMDTMQDRTPSTTAQSGTMGSATGSPTQVNPDAQDSNRQASQGMAPSADRDDVSSRLNAPGSDLRNDRTTMARAPRADRN
ncbi:MAG TPA: hypothetical protein VK047_11920 [Zeimonas sp.]|nr:hypothetical protein [Zeimonas sp.]